jgi:hypothetical protein
MTPATVLRDAFTGARALVGEGRSELARVLGCPPGGIDEAPLGDLTDCRHRRCLAAAVELAAEPDEVLAALGGIPLAELVPGAPRLPDSSIDAALCPPRLLAPLRCYDSLRWSSVLALTLGDVLQWTGVGPRGAAQLLGLSFERSLVGLVEGRGDNAAGGASLDLALLVGYEDRFGGGALRGALTHLAGDAHPEPVRRSAVRLLGCCHGLDVAQAGGSPVVDEVLDKIVEAAGSARDQAVFRARELSVNDRLTLEQLARRFRLSQERIRQLRARAADRVLAAAAEAPEWVQHLTGGLRDRLGAAAPSRDVTTVLAQMGWCLPAAANEQLVLWLAGPYRPVRAGEGWLAIEPDRLVALTKRALCGDGGVRLADEMSAELARMGVVAAHRDGWLRACGAVLVDGMVASTAGNRGDVLERLLFATGRPMSTSELAALVSNGANEEAQRAVLRRDRRFTAADGHADAFELVEWRPAARSARPVAPADDPVPEPGRPDTAGLSSIDGRLWLRVAVDAALLSGTHHPAPSVLAEALGLASGHRRTFASRYGPLSLINDDCGEPSIESLRPVALASGAGQGDTLVLGFTADGTLTVKLLTGDEPTSEQREQAQGAR